MNNYSDDTIFALSTPVGGAIALIRVSGALALPAARHIFTGSTEPRIASFGRLHDGERIIDEVVSVFYKAPNSYTGEDMIELSIHGSYAVASEVSALLQKQGMRPAEAGEFTKRAFLNGKLDLIQADAVMDIIASTSRASAEAAMEQLAGGLSRRIAEIEDKLTDALSEISAAIDYPEEMEDEVRCELPLILSAASEEIARLIANGRNNRVLREGASVVIAGPVNAGKSSLMNALCDTDRAIVTANAGTTRDIIEEHLSIRGVPVRLWDTAGIRSSADEAERIGIERALAALKTAQVVILLLDASLPLPADIGELLSHTRPDNRIIALNKSDLLVSETADTCAAKELLALLPDETPIFISCKTHEGLEQLKDRTAALIRPDCESAIVTNERHIARLEAALSCIDHAIAAPDAELSSIDIRAALTALGEITGRTVDDGVIDRIFERFCVGK